MTKTYKDTAGNELRNENGQWQILKKGVGWVEFVGKTWLADGTCIDQSPPVEPNDAELIQRDSENDLFIHFAGLAMQGLTQRIMPKDTAEVACIHAQAMIDELKKRNKL